MKKLVLILPVILAFLSCERDKKDTSIIPTKENLTGIYKITAATINAGGTIVDVYNNEAYVKACQRDDSYELKSDYTLIVTDEGTVCNPPNDFTSTWALHSTTQIELDGKLYTIRSWDGKNLVGDYMDMGLTATITYTKQ